MNCLFKCGFFWTCGFFWICWRKINIKIWKIVDNFLSHFVQVNLELNFLLKRRFSGNFDDFFWFLDFRLPQNIIIVPQPHPQSIKSYIRHWIYLYYVIPTYFSIFNTAKISYKGPAYSAIPLMALILTIPLDFNCFTHKTTRITILLLQRYDNFRDRSLLNP